MFQLFQEWKIKDPIAFDVNSRSLEPVTSFQIQYTNLSFPIR